jgi:hypothetical protein
MSDSQAETDKFFDGIVAEMREAGVLPVGRSQPAATITELSLALEKIGVKASGGLTSFSAEAKHEFLLDIARICKELGFEVPAL